MSEIKKKIGIATFGAGCFWGVEETFRRVKGVVDVVVGFMGGTTVNPNYKDVCRGDTGHAEVAQVTYDPKQVSYEKLLQVFWESHNPTTSNRQGADIGAQYRSAIFFHTKEQEQIAIKSKEELQKLKKYENPIVTEITPASRFYRAEEYHQRYIEKQGGGVCHI